jgi:hypothetical protein
LSILAVIVTVVTYMPDGTTGHTERTAAAARTFYVSASGSDAKNGRSRRTAWRTLARVSAARLRPGDRVLFRAGNRWSGQLRIDASGVEGRPIVFASFGRGAEPTFTPRGDRRCTVVNGDHVVLRRLRVTRCVFGISVFGDHVRVDRARLTYNGVGVRLESEADASVVARSRFARNNTMVVNTPGGDDDWGAMAILVAGEGADVHHNIIAGSIADSHDYGQDGAAIEVYGGRDSRVHHNLSIDNKAFAELGNDDSARNSLFHNVVRATIPSAYFLAVHGHGRRFGPVRGTVAYNNSVYLSGNSSTGIWCGGCASDVLVLRNNAMKVTGGHSWRGADEAYNIVDGDYVHGSLGPGSRRANPLFVSKKNLRLQRRSPAIDAGTNMGARVDFVGVSIPQGRAPDVGAYERRPGR